MGKLFVRGWMIVATVVVATIIAGCGGGGSTKSDAAQAFQAPDVAAAADRVQTYAVNVCGARS